MYIIIRAAATQSGIIDMYILYIPPTATTTFNRFLTGRQRNFRVDSVVVIVMVVSVIVSLIRLILLYMYNALFRRTCQNNSIGKKVFFFLSVMHTQRFIILLYTNPLRYSSLKSFRGGGKIRRKGVTAVISTKQQPYTAVK